MSPLLIALIVCNILANASPTQSLINGLAQRPPMGWISWERFTCDTDCRGPNADNCIGERLYKRTADIMAREFKQFGYEYINIDDCWSKMERVDGKLEADTDRFGADGIKGLADHVHGLGLKLGIYGDCGTKTCAGYPAQLAKFDSGDGNYFEVDAQTFKSWEIDSFKFDGCNVDNVKAESICPGMKEALNKTGRPILLTCEWPFYLIRYAKKTPDFGKARDSCNLWRYYDDIMDSWGSVLNLIEFTVNMQNTIVDYHGPGSWFDPDQLVIGGFALSHEQALAQMAIWSIWSAPLFMSNDLNKLEPEFANILKNEELINVNQDKLGVFALMTAQRDEPQGKSMAFVKPVMPFKHNCPSFVILYFYRSSLGNTFPISFKLKDLLVGAEKAINVAFKRIKQSSSTCLARIKGTACPITKFQWKDLIKPESGIIFMNDSLTLPVNPSGIRIIELEEI